MVGLAAVVLHPGAVVKTAWRFDGGRLSCSVPCDTAHPALVAAPDGGRLVLEAGPRSIDVIDSRTGRVLRTITGQGPLEISHDGARLVGRNVVGAPAVWALPTGRVIYAYDWPAGPAPGLQSSERLPHPVLAAALPDGRRILVFWRRFASRWENRIGPGDVLDETMSSEETLTINKIPSRKLLQSATLGTVVQQVGPTGRLTVSADAAGRRLLVRPPGSAFLFWDTAVDAAPRAVAGVGKLENARLLPDGRRLLGWNDSSLLLIEVDSMKVVWSVEAGLRVSAVTLLSDGSRVAFGTTNGAVSVIDTGTGQIRSVYSVGEKGDFVAALSFSNNGRALVLATDRGALMKIVAKERL